MPGSNLLEPLYSYLGQWVEFRLIYTLVPWCIAPDGEKCRYMPPRVYFCAQVCDLVDPLWWICINDRDALTAGSNSQQAKFKAYRHLTIEWPTHALPIQAIGFQGVNYTNYFMKYETLSIHTGKAPLSFRPPGKWGIDHMPCMHDGLLSKWLIKTVQLLTGISRPIRKYRKDGKRVVLRLLNPPVFVSLLGNFWFLLDS